MQQDALRVARELLTIRPVHPFVFFEALSAVLIQADRLHHWRKSVEKAYAEIQPIFQPLIASQMLGFYVSLKQWQKAEQFLPKRPTSVEELTFAMWTWLHLGQIKKAATIERKCLKMLKVTNDGFVGSMLLDALGDYYAQTGDWNSAETASVASPPQEPLFDNAVTRLVEIQAVRGRVFANIGQKKLKNTQIDEFDLMLPGNRKARSLSVHTELEKYKSALLRIVPKNALWRFGLSEGAES
jgi:hypothetical protein